MGRWGIEGIFPTFPAEKKHVGCARYCTLWTSFTVLHLSALGFLCLLLQVWMGTTRWMMMKRSSGSSPRSWSCRTRWTVRLGNEADTLTDFLDSVTDFLDSVTDFLDSVMDFLDSVMDRLLGLWWTSWTV